MISNSFQGRSGQTNIVGHIDVPVSQFLSSFFTLIVSLV